MTLLIIWYVYKKQIKLCIYIVIWTGSVFVFPEQSNSIDFSIILC